MVESTPKPQNYDVQTPIIDASKFLSYAGISTGRVSVDEESLSPEVFRERNNGRDTVADCRNFARYTQRVIGDDTSLSDTKRSVLLDACAALTDKAPLPGYRLGRFVSNHLNDPRLVTDILSIYSHGEAQQGLLLKQVAKDNRTNLIGDATDESVFVLGVNSKTRSVLEGLCESEGKKLLVLLPHVTDSNFQEACRELTGLPIDIKEVSDPAELRRLKPRITIVDSRAMSRTIERDIEMVIPLPYSKEQKNWEDSVDDVVVCGSLNLWIPSADYEDVRGTYVLGGYGNLTNKILKERAGGPKIRVLQENGLFSPEEASFDPLINYLLIDTITDDVFPAHAAISANLNGNPARLISFASQTDFWAKKFRKKNTEMARILVQPSSANAEEIREFVIRTAALGIVANTFGLDRMSEYLTAPDPILGNRTILDFVQEGQLQELALRMISATTY